MESDFKNCHMFLVTVLNKAVCRGSFPYRKLNPVFSSPCSNITFCQFHLDFLRHEFSFQLSCAFMY
uniref:Uncharacterized protein n=1 Tax=Anguilla anguilla TaxID=7936 RepID=A0A0E9SVA1_ANGAN